MDEDFKNDDILGRWLGGSLSPEEEAALRKREDFPDFERLVQATDRLAAPTFDTDAQLARLKQRRTAQPNQGAGAGAIKGKGARVRRIAWMAAAASILLLLAVWFLRPADALLYATASGETQTIDLPDGSAVRLNAVSTLNYVAETDTRTATLTGEAFFEVEKDGRTFVVQTDYGTVTVLGTSFNVYSRDGDLRVSCRTGRVRVDINGTPTGPILTPGQSVSLQGGAQVEESTVLADEALDWLTGRSRFDSRPLGEVIAELERQFGLSIQIGAEISTEQRLTTTFPHDDAETALEIVFGSLDGLTYRREGDRVMVGQ